MLKPMTLGLLGFGLLLGGCGAASGPATTHASAPSTKQVAEALATGAFETVPARAAQAPNPATMRSAVYAALGAKATEGTYASLKQVLSR